MAADGRQKQAAAAVAAAAAAAAAAVFAAVSTRSVRIALLPSGVRWPSSSAHRSTPPLTCTYCTKQTIRSLWQTLVNVRGREAVVAPVGMHTAPMIKVKDLHRLRCMAHQQWITVEMVMGLLSSEQDASHLATMFMTMLC
jgi:hypothetical protein